MELQKRTLQVGAAVIACALLLRFGGDRLGSLTQALGRPEVASVFLFLETGRIVRPSDTQATQSTTPTNPTECTEPTEPTTVPVPTGQDEEKTMAVFAPEDTTLVEINNISGCETDIAAFLEQPLTWDLTQEDPAVLILHTHGSESYVNSENYTEVADYHTLDTHYNIVSIGQAIADNLTAGGIRVLHDTTTHDYPSYNSSYAHARKSMQAYLQEYPSIKLILDIHRDSAEDKNGNQIAPTVVYNGQTAAQVMLVMGTDAAGFIHPQWQENMALAVKLQAQLEKQCAGICRPISLRSQRFNQDLSPGALLVEVGAAGNTRQEALAAADVLSQAILDLAYGATTNYYSS